MSLTIDCESETVKDLTSAFGQALPYKPGPIDPVALFRSLKIRPGSGIKELWAPQADALRAWQSNRHFKDTIIKLNTGAGKTLIGLIAAQSLVNESRSRVLYCCATKQLVDQTREKAEELGLITAGYHSATWVRQDLYQMSQAPVVTTYAALLNGKSIFQSDPVKAVIFDDAHTAHDGVRSAFTLSIDRQRFGRVYDEITKTVRPYFESVDREFVFNAVVEQRDPASVLMVPLFESQRHVDRFRDLLLDAGVERERALLFEWSHLGEKLDRCALLFDQNRVEFSPLLPPVQECVAFRDGVRRIYLSATLRVDDEFVRTFGRTPDLEIGPGGRAGDTERLILFPPADSSDVDARAWAEETTRGLKAAVMVPSRPAVEPWRDYADVFESDDGHARVRQFAKSVDERLVFVARYDGIDLPDDDCRVMVVDGLPAGMALIDRFFEQHLERRGITGGKVASRFLQLLGRTSRGMSDYGAVLLVGARLLNWILLPESRRYLPPHVQRQLAVGERLSRLDDFSARELVDHCLQQTEQWATIYERGMGEAHFEEPDDGEVSAELSFALAEREASDALWAGEFESGARALLDASDAAFAAERSLGVWFLHWAGFGRQRLGDMTGAKELYRRAAAAKRDLGRLPELQHVLASDQRAFSQQAEVMAGLLESRGAIRVSEELQAVSSELLDSEASAGVHEEAIRRLGEHLGFEATRPEKETNGKGPDGLWVTPDRTLVMLFDAKTGMRASRYSKKRIGESAQHALWAADRYPRADRFHYLVGPRVPATPQSTPPPGLRVVMPAELARISADLLATYRRAVDRNLPLFHAAEVEMGLSESGLAWRSLPESLESVRLDSL